MHIYRSCW